MASGGQERPDLITVDACIHECMNTFQSCAAVDFFEGKCYMHDKNSFKHAKMDKEKKGATQYLAKPCKDN